MGKSFRATLTLALVLVLVVCSPVPAADSLVFGVHPFKKPTQLVKEFLPLTEYLSKELGMEIKLVVGKSYEEVIHGYETGKIDIGFMGPSAFALEGAKGSVKPLARIQVNGVGSFQGVVVVRSDSPIKTLADLKGQSFAFGDPESTLSHYVPHFMLMQHGIYLKDLSRYAFVGNHDNVALNVLQGNFVAGGLKPETAKHYLARGLKVLATSEPVPEHVFVAGSKLDQRTFERIRKALLQADLALLKPVNSSITGLENAKAGDYQKLRTLMTEVDTRDPAGKK